MTLDADDIDRMERLDLDLLRRRISALRALPIPRGSADWGFVAKVSRRNAAELTPDERHGVAVLCWTWRRRNLPHGLAPKINPNDPLSRDQLALAMGCTPTIAEARVEMAGARI